MFNKLRDKRYLIFLFDSPSYKSRKLHGAAGIMAGRGYLTLKPYETSKSSRNGYLKYTEKDCIFPLIYIQLNMRIVQAAYLHGRFQIFRESPCF